MLKSRLTAAAVATVLTAATGAAFAQTTQLRIHTHFQEANVSGRMATEFVDDVEAMSNGEIEIELFYGGALAKSNEIFDAAVTGVVDCDMSGGNYQVGKNPAFQFVGDLGGGVLAPL